MFFEILYQLVSFFHRLLSLLPSFSSFSIIYKMSTADIITICFIAVSIISIVGNILVVLFIYSVKKHERTKLMMVKSSLAVSDLGYSINLLLSLVVYCNSAVCEYASDSVTAGFSCISFYNLCLMAAQRCYAIKSPFKYQQISRRTQCIFIFIVWMTGIPCIAAKFMLPLKWSQGLQVDIYYRIYAVLVYHLPISLTLLFTIAMYVVHFMSIRNARIRHVSSTHDDSKLVKMTSLIVLGYLVTCVPCMMFVRNNPVWQNVIESVYTLHALCDVIVYSVLDNEFKQYMASLLLCCPFRKKKIPKGCAVTTVTQITAGNTP